LIGHGRSFNWHIWWALLAVGRANGWQPQGTKGHDADLREQSAGCSSNNYQRVSDDDAFALGVAILDACRQPVTNGCHSAVLTSAVEEAGLEPMLEFAIRAVQYGFRIG